MSGNASPQVTNRSGSKYPSVQKRKSTNLPNTEKKIGEDEFMAAAIGDVEWLKQSIRGNRGVINYDKNGLSPLHLAAIHGRVECLRLIIEKFKVDISLPSKTGWRPIHLVISNQTGKRAFNSLCYLLEQGADPSIGNDDGISPMHQAASEGHVQCLKALIEAGAPADGLDYRGHTPIDLAKLWGHRKCARLLAAEKWQQDKRVLAHEMNQLQKMEMQKALRAIEEDEENKADKEFYGDLAFKEWLNMRGLEPKPTGPKAPEIEEEEIVAPAAKGSKGAKLPSSTQKRDGLQKANSVQRPRAVAQVKPPSPIREETMSSNRSTRSSAKTPNKARATFSPETTESHTLLLEPPGEKVDPETAVPLGNSMHMSDWNKSTKVKQSCYLPILGDHYPRDEYSMLPKHSPRRLSKTPTPGYTDEPVEVPAVNDELAERPVVYKCKHVGDVHKKKHYEPECLPRSEVGMHLSMDPDSQIFKSGLLLPIRKTTASKRSRREPHSSSTDLQSMMQMMERMSNTTPYFPIQGSTSDANMAAVF